METQQIVQNLFIYLISHRHNLRALINLQTQTRTHTHRAAKRFHIHFE